MYSGVYNFVLLMVHAYRDRQLMVTSSARVYDMAYYVCVCFTWWRFLSTRRDPPHTPLRVRADSSCLCCREMQALWPQNYRTHISHITRLRVYTLPIFLRKSSTVKDRLTYQHEIKDFGSRYTAIIHCCRLTILAIIVYFGYITESYYGVPGIRLSMYVS